MDQGDDAEHNWDKVLCKYGSTGTYIEDAFYRAGYYKPRAAILRAIRDKGWAKSRIAHSLGDGQSGVRAGTIEKINRCSADVLAWLVAHPPGGSASGSSKPWASRKKKAQVEEDDSGYDAEAFRLLQLTKWAKEGNRDSIIGLAQMAARGHPVATRSLLGLVLSGNKEAWTAGLAAIVPIRGLSDALVSEALDLLSSMLVHIRTLRGLIERHESTFWSLTSDTDLLPFIGICCEHCLNLSYALRAIRETAEPAAAKLVEFLGLEVADIEQILRQLRLAGDRHALTIRLVDIEGLRFRLELVRKRLGG